MTPKIAVVDDDLLVRNGIASLLRSSGLVACPFGSAQAFLQSKQTTSFDLLISDYRMPGMTGIDLTKALRLSGDPMPIIIITALQTETAEAAEIAGVLAVLRKPFEHAVLLDLVKRTVG